MSKLKDKVEFGITTRKKLTGADLYVKIFQITSLLPLIYIFTASGYLGIFREKSILSMLFDIGIMGLPRAETLTLSTVYRQTGSELLVYFAILAVALILGLLSHKLFKEDLKRGIACRKVFVVLIAIDLVIRMIPLRFNLVMGWPALIVGFILRLGCVLLIMKDLKAEKITQ